jgi:hypothetical protein
MHRITGPPKGQMCRLAACVAALGITAIASADQFRFRYVSLLNGLQLPAGYAFFDPTALTNRGVVYGVAYDDANFAPHVAVYANGQLTVLVEGFVRVANEHGTLGGFVIDELDATVTHAALFKGTSLEIVPPQPGEIQAEVVALNDGGAAVVSSIDDTFQQKWFVYEHGRLSEIVLPEGAFAEGISNQGLIAGTFHSLEADRAFRFDSRRNTLTVLDPVAPDSNSWGLGINNSGQVLGYSFEFDGLERVGIWNRRGEFETYFIEGTSEFPTVSNRLLFNDNDLIAITRIGIPAAETTTSYLVPKPGVRLDLSALVTNLPTRQRPNRIIDMNNHGDMIGWSLDNFNLNDIYLLERTGAGSSAAASSTSSTEPLRATSEEHVPIQHLQMNVPISFVNFIECAPGGGEWVEFTGRLGGIVHATQRGSQHVAHSIDLQLAGRGLSTGERYRWAESAPRAVRWSSDGSGSEDHVGVLVTSGTSLAVMQSLALSLEDSGPELSSIRLTCR